MRKQNRIVFCESPSAYLVSAKFDGIPNPLHPTKRWQLARVLYQVAFGCSRQLVPAGELKSPNEMARAHVLDDDLRHHGCMECARLHLLDLADDLFLCLINVL